MSARPRTVSACATLVVSLVCLSAGSTAARATGTRVCDGYAACTAAGFPAHGYGAHAGSLVLADERRR